MIHFGTSGSFTVASEFEQALRIVVHDNHRAVDWLDEAFGHRLIDECRQRRVEPADVQQPAWLAMHAQLRPRHRFEEFLEGSDAAGHGDERVGELRHQRLARMHRVDHPQIGDAGVGDLPVGERLRDHTDHLTAAGKDRIGDDAHQPDVAAAVDEADASSRQQGAHRLGHLPVDRLIAGARSAVDTDTFHKVLRS